MIERVAASGDRLETMLELDRQGATRLIELVQLLKDIPVEGGEDTARIDDQTLRDFFADPEAKPATTCSSLVLSHDVRSWPAKLMPRIHGFSSKKLCQTASRFPPQSARASSKASRSLRSWWNRWTTFLR